MERATDQATDQATGRGAGAQAAADEIEANRAMLFGLAYRMLGSAHDAEDVLQEAYLRWLRADREAVAEPRRYLSRVVTRLAIDQLRARQQARETYPGPWLPEPVPTDPSPFGPLETAWQRESLSIAVLHLLERLSPPERAVFVLRTSFELPYAEIAEILDRTQADCRQLYHRAALRVGSGPPRYPADRGTRERLLARFIGAAREGDVAGLARLLAEDATSWADGGGRVRTARQPVRGAEKIARLFVGVHARYGTGASVEPAEFNGGPALVIRWEGLVQVLTVAVVDGTITDVYVVANPDKLGLVR